MKPRFIESSFMEVPDPFENSGAFETCRVREGKILYFSDHLERLKASLQTLGILFSDEKQVIRELRQTAREVKEGLVRIAIRRGGKSRLVIHQRAGVAYTRKQLFEGISVTTVATRHPIGEAVHPQAKQSQQLAGILAKAEAPHSLEALRIEPHGYLTEGTVSNIFLVKEGTLRTPPGWLGILKGVMRSKVLEAASHLKIPTEEIPFTRHDLFNAEEVFLTNVLMEILPVREVDGRMIGAAVPGPMTRRLRQRLAAKRGR